MSSIPTKQIDGDVAVGRNVSAGGNATVRGSATIGHNLKVLGWLDAPNIKGPNKGVFTDYDKLQESYPHPQNGWYALVGTTLPAMLYVTGSDDKGRKIWVPTGEMAGNPTVEFEEYNKLVSEYVAKLECIEGDVSNNKDRIAQICNHINSIGSKIDTLSGEVAGIEKRVNSTEFGLKEINSQIGQPNGIAPLDESGRIPARHIPGAYDDVLEFAGFRESVPEIKDGQGVVSLYGGAIYFCTPLGRFIYRVPLRNDGPMLTEDDVEYWNTWPNAGSWGEHDEKGHIPERGKIYVDIHRNRSYRWSGTTLASLDDGVALGYTPQTAFPGNEGLAAAKAAAEALSRLNRFDVLPLDSVYDTLAEAQKHQPVPGFISWIKDESAFYISSADEGWSLLRDELYNSEMLPGKWLGLPTHLYSYRSQLYILRSVESPNPDIYNVWFELVDYNQHITDLVSSLNNRITKLEDDMKNLKSGYEWNEV